MFQRLKQDNTKTKRTESYLKYTKGFLLCFTWHWMFLPAPEPSDSSSCYAQSPLLTLLSHQQAPSGAWFYQCYEKHVSGICCSQRHPCNVLSKHRGFSSGCSQACCERWELLSMLLGASPGKHLVETLTQAVGLCRAWATNRLSRPAY